MKFFYKMLWRFFGEKLIFSKELNHKDIRKWLMDSYGNRGLKGYYTIRKKAIETQMGMGLENREYWEMVGRVKELKTLTRKIDEEAKRIKKEDEKV